MANIQTFTSIQFGEVRTITDDNGQILFSLTDLCKALNLHSNVVKQRLEKDVCSTYPLQTNGGIQQVNFVNEDGMYDVILDSRKPQAKAFRKWITSEVLPSIRRTGGYISTNPSDTPEEIMARALIVAQKTIEQGRQRIQMLESENESLTQENRALAPRAAYTDRVLQSASTYTFTQMAKELGFTSVNTLIRKLRDRHVIFRQSGQWLLMAKYSAHGYTATRTAHYFRADGTPDCSVSTVWTERGRAFLHTLLGEKGGER